MCVESHREILVVGHKTGTRCNGTFNVPSLVSTQQKDVKTSHSRDQPGNMRQCLRLGCVNNQCHHHHHHHHHHYDHHYHHQVSCLPALTIMALHSSLSCTLCMTSFSVSFQIHLVRPSKPFLLCLPVFLFP